MAYGKWRTYKRYHQQMNSRLDAHQHFWTYNAEKHDWIDDSMKAIQQDFSPSMLLEILKRNHFDGCISVQVDQTEEETVHLLNLADNHSFIKGVVGWIDLQSPDVNERLNYFSQFKILKGYRHIVQSEKDTAFLERPHFLNGIKHLKNFDLTYDILIYPHQLKMATEFAGKFPDQRFILNHVAKPYIKKGLIDDWKNDLQELAALENVWCKISGLVTEADWYTYSAKDLFPYIETAIEAFGINRVIYGSDWPVCLVAAPYEKVLGIIEEVFERFSKEDAAKFFGLNANEFYKLND